MDKQQLKDEVNLTLDDKVKFASLILDFEDILETKVSPLSTEYNVSETCMRACFASYLLQTLGVGDIKND